MEILIISLTAFGASLLTFFSGFGLGTILTPVFIVFFPIDVAIACTGLVHFLNNIYKLILVGRHANKAVLIRFGIPAVIASFLGAWLFLNLADTAPLFTYEAFGKDMEIYLVKLLIAILLIIFALMDLLPFFNRLQFSKDKLPLGGLLSGFFGGLSGNQGALRSAFLIKAGLSKEAFIGTAVVVSTFVDFTRLSVYASAFSFSTLGEHRSLLLCATLAAVSGAFLGNKLLKKVSLTFIRVFVAVLLLILAVAMGFGVI